MRSSRIAFMKKSLFSRLTALFTSLAVTSAYAPAVSAADETLVSASLDGNIINYDNPDDVELQELTIVEGDESEFGYVPYKYVDKNGNTVSPQLIPERQKGAVELPTHFDLRENGLITSVKSQGQTNSCWAHASLAAAESNMVMKGLATNNIDLSEAHLVWFGHCRYSTNPDDILYHTGSNLGIEGYTTGGNVSKVRDILSRGTGVELEENYPSITEKPNLDNYESSRYSSYGYLSKSIDIDKTDRETAKRYLADTGALTVSYYCDDELYATSDRISYYCNDRMDPTDANHMVTIVGWDDTYSKYNFKTFSTGNGAWICKNSWGSYNTNGGYFYLSYYDKSIDYFSSFEITSADKYDKIYQYTANATNTCYYPDYGINSANIYKAERTEKIKAVSFETAEANVPYTISIYKDAEFNKPDSGTIVHSQAGTADYAGYHLIDLDKTIGIEKDTCFRIVITFSKKSAAFYRDDVLTKSGTSFVSPYFIDTKSSGSWQDINTKGGEICVKIFTEEAFPIDEKHFPDTVFRNWVSANTDTDKDGWLSANEFNNVRIIDVTGCPIKDLAGIEYFPELEILNCDKTNVLWINAENNPKISSISANNIERNLGDTTCSEIASLGIDTSRIKLLMFGEIQNGYVMPNCIQNGDVLVPLLEGCAYNYICNDNYIGTFALKLSSIRHDNLIISSYDESGHTLSCSGCGYSETSDHILGSWSADEYSHQRSCSKCEYKESAEHTLGQVKIDDAATHSQDCSVCQSTIRHNHNLSVYTDNNDGTHTKSCSDCPYFEIEEHSLGSWTDNNDGTSTRECEYCDFSENSAHVFSRWTDMGNGTHKRTCVDCERTETADHSYSQYEDMGDGTHKRICVDCGYSETDNHRYQPYVNANEGSHTRVCEDCSSIETSDHNFSVWTDNSNGTHSRVCADCDYTETSDHSLGEWKNNKNGTHSRSCTVCGYTETSDHSLSEWKNNNDGTHSRNCTVCGYTETKSHTLGTYTNNNNGTHSVSCTDCGYSDTSAHTLGEWTDLGNGIHSRACTKCKYSEAAKHSMSNWTDNHDGTHSRDCSVCGHSETSNHSLSGWKDNKDGTHSKTCADCNYSETSKHSLSAWKDNKDGTHSRTCTVCGYTETKAHTLTSYVNNNNGTHSASCTDCGYSDASAHTLGEWTDLGNGIHSRACTKCKYSEAAKHSHGAAVNNNDGTHSFRCTDCNAAETAEHSFSSWILKSNATKTRVCFDCGASETVTIRFIRGDMNNDGIVNSMDISVMRKSLVNGLSNPEALFPADTNEDGDFSIADLVKLQRIILNK